MWRRLPAVGSTDLWLIDLDAPLRPGEALCLSADEQARAARFRFDRDRRRYLQAHIALRGILGGVVGGLPGDLVFGIGIAGKPHLPHHPGCRFNLSHSGGHGLVATSGIHEVGADIEHRRPLDDRAALARQHFADVELAAMAADADDHTAFLHGWTRKEACLKAVGTGLDRDLRQVVTGCSGAPQTVTLDLQGTPTRVVVESFLESEGLVIAVAQVMIAEGPTDATPC